MNNIEHDILKLIKADQVTMHSRYRFMLHSLLFVTAVVLIALTLIYLLSFIAFMVSGNGLHNLPSFGVHGWQLLFSSLPWFTLLLAGICFLLLQILSTHFSFVYKRPLVYTALGSIVVLVVGGGIIASTSLHERLYEASQNGRLPIAQPLYRHTLEDAEGVIVGLLHQREDVLLLESRDGSVYTLIVTDDSRMPPYILASTTPVMVIGEHDGEIVTVEGIRPLKAPLPPRGMKYPMQ